MREIEGRALLQVVANDRPLVLLPGIAEQVLDNRSAPDRLGNIKESFTRLEAVLLGQLPAGTVLANANDDLDTVVAHIVRLAAALDSVANHGDRLLAENLAQLGRRKIRPLNNLFLHSADG